MGFIVLFFAFLSFFSFFPFFLFNSLSSGYKLAQMYTFDGRFPKEKGNNLDGMGWECGKWQTSIFNTMDLTYRRLAQSGERASERPLNTNNYYPVDTGFILIIIYHYYDYFFNSFAVVILSPGLQ